MGGKIDDSAVDVEGVLKRPASTSRNILSRNTRYSSLRINTYN